MEIQLSDHFTYKKLIKFVLPSIVMMIFTSIYGVVDGLFVSNFAGKTAFAAINLIMPILMGLSALGFMIGTGGSAIVATTLGEGKKEKANEYFSMLVYVTIIGGIAVSLLGMILIRPIAVMLGAAGELLSDCVLYGRITFISFPAFMLHEMVGVNKTGSAYHFHQIYNTVKPGDFRGTFSYLKHFNNRRDFIRAKI